LCDVKLIASNGYEIWAHKIILSANSEYFNIMFNSRFKEARETELYIQDLEPYALAMVIDFIYTSEIILSEQHVQV